MRISWRGYEAEIERDRDGNYSYKVLHNGHELFHIPTDTADRQTATDMADRHIAELVKQERAA